jgi:(p)ppGpp synthase/HD superfamily hydrolase
MGIFEIVIQISDLDHLTKVIRSLKRVKGFLNYERVK